MKKQEEEKRLFAFWRYDTFPFVLGGEITSFERDGLVKVKGYDGMLFRPIKIMRLAEGAEIWKKIEVIREQERRSRVNHDKKWRSRIVELLPEVDGGHR